MNEIQFAGLPVRAALDATGLFLVLRQIAPRELRDAFMQQTVARHSAAETIIHTAKSEVGNAPAGTSPAGFVFHVSRCGSTLISQALKQLGNLTVYAEPQPVNEILAPPHTWPRDDRVAALRSLGAAFARHARTPYILKLSSWNLLYGDVLSDAFPETPWALSLRDPIEVCVSLLAHQPGWFNATSASARELATTVSSGATPASREEFVARVYGAFCAAALRLDASRGRLVAYEALPEAIWKVVAPHFALPVDDSQKQMILQISDTNVKAPIDKPATFFADANAKRRAASPQLIGAIDAFARPHLDELWKRFAP